MLQGVMPIEAPPSQDSSWRIFREQGGRLIYLGIVQANDKPAAIRQAMGEFELMAPEHASRLVAEML